MHPHPVANGLLSGAVAAVVAALIHLVFLQPILMRAEEYEKGARTHVIAAVAGHDHSLAAPATVQADHPHAGVPSRLDMPLDLTRDAQTVGFLLVTYAGFGMLMAGAVDLARRRGYCPARGHAVLWGLAGFTAFALVPGFGLPPELPGTSAGTLVLRQIWWVAAAAATLTMLTGLAYGRARIAVAIAGAAALALLMTFVPEPAVLEGPVPPELAALFAARSLGLSAVAWQVLAWAAMRRPETVTQAAVPG